jgi:excisionase family DNA binding protein
MKNVYTTGEAARICRVSQQAVIRAFDTGRLKGFRFGGSRFRKIPREALEAYMVSIGLPLGWLAEADGPVDHEAAETTSAVPAGA